MDFQWRAGLHATVQGPFPCLALCEGNTVLFIALQEPNLFPGDTSVADRAEAASLARYLVEHQAR